MACTDYTELRDFWANGQFWDAVNCYYANQVGAEAFQLMVFGTLFITLFVYSRRPIIPVVLMILFGGIFIAPLPAAFVNAAVVVAVIVVAALIMLLAIRARSEPPL